MMQFGYLAALLVSIGCLMMIDRRFRLAWWADARATLATILLTVAIFIVWDLLGIGLGVFWHGGGAYSLPIRLLPEFPLEELFFLWLLSYVTLLLYTGGRKLWPPM